MTKAGLVRILLEQQSGFTRTQAARTVDTLLAVMKERILRGDRILITNFGSFEVMSRKRRRGRNPITGEIITILPRRTLVFRSAKKLEEQLN